MEVFGVVISCLNFLERFYEVLLDAAGDGGGVESERVLDFVGDGLALTDGHVLKIRSWVEF